MFTQPVVARTWLALSACILIGGCRSGHYDDSVQFDEDLVRLLPSPEVQVRVFEGPRCELLCEGPVALVDTRRQRLLFEGFLDRRTPVTVDEDGNIHLGSSGRPGPIEVVPLDGSDGAPGSFLALVSEGRQRRYRGSLILEAKGGQLTVLSRVSLEEYVVGVLGAEMPLSYPLEALKAQAIVARTFALYELLWARGHGGVRPFKSDTSFQVYRGIQPQDARAMQAVVETAGQVLLFRDQLFRSYFHSTCGGRTASAVKVFGDAAIAPLDGTLCDACGDSQFARWERRLTPQDVEDALAAWVARHGQRLESVRELEARRDEFGRVETVFIHHTGRGLGVSGQQFRRLLRDSGKPLRSATFEVRRDGEEFVFVGQGFGHRVGLCQVGAGRKAKDESCWQILAHYYPESVVERLESLY